MKARLVANCDQFSGDAPLNGNDPTGTTGVLKLIDSAIKLGGRLGKRETRELDARMED